MKDWDYRLDGYTSAAEQKLNLESNDIYVETESRKEVLDRLNDIDDDNIDAIRLYELPDIAEYAKELWDIARKSLADAPYGGER